MDFAYHPLIKNFEFNHLNMPTVSISLKNNFVVYRYNYVRYEQNQPHESSSTTHGFFSKSDFTRQIIN